MDPEWIAMVSTVLYLLHVYDPAGYALVEKHIAMDRFQTPIITPDGSRTGAGSYGPQNPYIAIDYTWFDQVWGNNDWRDYLEATGFVHEARHIENNSPNELAPRLQTYITVVKLGMPDYLQKQHWQFVLDTAPDVCTMDLSSYPPSTAIMRETACANARGDSYHFEEFYAQLPQGPYLSGPEPMRLSGMASGPQWMAADCMVTPKQLGFPWVPVAVGVGIGLGAYAIARAL